MYRAFMKSVRLGVRQTSLGIPAQLLTSCVISVKTFNFSEDHFSLSEYLNKKDNNVYFTESSQRAFILAQCLEYSLQENVTSIIIVKFPDRPLYVYSPTHTHIVATQATSHAYITELQ